MLPTYSLLFKGKSGSNQARFGEVFGEIPAKKIPDFLEELAQLKVKSKYKDFVLFIENKETEIKELVTKYEMIESFGENPNLYCDFE